MLRTDPKPFLQRDGVFRSQIVPIIFLYIIRMHNLNLPDNQNPLIEILLSCLHRDSSRFPIDQLHELHSDQWNTLVDLAVEHRVVPMLHQKLSENNVTDAIDKDDYAFKTLLAYSRQVAKNNLRFLGELRAFLQECNQNQIPVILLKGIYLAGQVYDNPGLREMNDIDLLFKSSDLDLAYRILTGMGYQSINPVQIENIENVISQHQHLAPLVREDVAAFELHWNITRPGKIYSINPGELWARVEPVKIAGEEACSLCPEDLLLHLCIHTSYQHNFSFGLRPFIDIAEVISKEKDRFNWTLFTKRVQKFQCGRGVFLALKISQSFIGASVPENVFTGLQPDDFDDQIMKTAVKQIFTKKEESGNVTPAMVNFAKDTSLSGRAKIILNQIFWPEHVMIKYYPVRKGSPKLYFYYLIRFWEVFKRNAGSTLKVFSKDAHLTGIADRKQKLRNWMKI